METRKKILEFIITYIKEHKYPPSVREIGEGVGLESTSSVHRQLEIMRLSGTIETDALPGTSRAIRIPGMKYMERGEMEQAEWISVTHRLPKNDDYILLSFENFNLPLVGRYETDKDGGAFYVGNEMESCSSKGLFVNAWRTLPKPYRPEEEGGD